MSENYWESYEIYEAADYIGSWLATYPRVHVTQYKEKFGEARVYCNLGWHNVSCLLQPGWYGYRFDNKLYQSLCRVELPTWLVNFSYAMHIKAYRWRYSRAVKKWPQYRDAILNGADHEEFLEGL